MKHNKIISETVSYVKRTFLSDASGHDWWHIYRVWQMSRKIHKKEGGNQFIVEMAAILHELDDYKFSTNFNDKIPIKTIEWLSNYDLDGQVKNMITSIVLNISFKGAHVVNNINSIEGMIVQDADRLDAIGAIGVARAFAFGGFKGHMLYDPNENPKQHLTFNEYKKRNSSSIGHFYEKLLLLKENMNTETGKQIAFLRHQYMQSFLDEFFLEWHSKDLEL